jgi:adenylate cyclase
VLFVERDRYAPRTLPMQLWLAPADAARLIAAIPNSDEVFAHALAAAPVVLGVAGIDEASPPAAQVAAAPTRQRSGDTPTYVRRYPGRLRSLYLLNAPVHGHGALHAKPERGILRLVPAWVGTAEGHRILGLAVVILHRPGKGEPLRVDLNGQGIRCVEVAGLRLPTRADGGCWSAQSRCGSRKPRCCWCSGCTPS